jgi:hypothetical protein
VLDNESQLILPIQQLPGSALRLKNFAEREPFDDKPWSSNKLREAYA